MPSGGACPPHQKRVLSPFILSSLMGQNMLQCDRSSDSILNKSINKNSILSKYNEDCHKSGYSGQLTSIKKVS